MKAKTKSIEKITPEAVLKAFEKLEARGEKITLDSLYDFLSGNGPTGRVSVTKGEINAEIEARALIFNAIVYHNFELYVPHYTEEVTEIKRAVAKLVYKRYHVDRSKLESVLNLTQGNVLDLTKEANKEIAEEKKVNGAVDEIEADEKSATNQYAEVFDLVGTEKLSKSEIKKGIVAVYKELEGKSRKEREEPLNMSGIYTVMEKRKMLPGIDEVGAKLLIFEVLKNDGLDIDPLVIEQMTEANRQVIIMLNKDRRYGNLGANTLSKHLGLDLGQIEYAIMIARASADKENGKKILDEKSKERQAAAKIETCTRLEKEISLLKIQRNNINSKKFGQEMDIKISALTDTLSALRDGENDQAKMLENAIYLLTPGRELP
ncbi:MAG: hypothetical protein ACREBF_02810 [Candidatus Micrarchaeales archaeon]